MLAVSVCPCCAVPEITGTLVFDGAVVVGGGGVPLPCTTAVAAETAVVEPEPFVAVTADRIVAP